MGVSVPVYQYIHAPNLNFDQIWSGFHSAKKHDLTFWQMQNANDLHAHTTAEFEDQKFRKILATSRIFTLKTKNATVGKLLDF